MIVNFAGLSKSLEPDDVVVVEISLVEWENSVVLIQLLEPGGLSWVDHGVFLKFDEHSSVETRESLFSNFGNVAGVDFLVVERWEEDAVSLVGGEVVDVSEISSWGHQVLGDWEVYELFDHKVEGIADNAFVAMWDCIDSHVWTTDGEHISDFTWHVAFFNDVSGQETTLGKSNNVEFSLEIWVGSNLLASFLSNRLKVSENFSERWKASLNAVSWGTSTFTDDFVDISDSWIEAHITEAMEHGSWYSFSFEAFHFLAAMMTKLVEWSIHSLFLRDDILNLLGVEIDPFLNVKAEELLWN